MTVVTIPDVAKYHLPRMILKKVEILNSVDPLSIQVSIDYDFQYEVKPGASATARLINKYIKPVVVAMPTIELALLYENYIKTYSQEIVTWTGKHMLPFSHYQTLQADFPIGEELTGYSYNFLNMRENKLLLAKSMIDSHYAIADNILGLQSSQGYAINTDGRVVTISDKQYYDPIRPAFDSVLKKINIKIPYNGRSVPRNRDQSRNSVDMYIYYFSWLDYRGLMNDNNFNSSDADMIDAVIYNGTNFTSEGGAKRNLFHGQVSKELILTGEFSVTKRNNGLKAPNNYQLLSRQDGSPLAGMRVVRHDGIYYGSDSLNATDSSLRAAARNNPSSLERLATRQIPNIKVVDKRQIYILSPNEKYKNMSYNYTLDIYENDYAHRSEIDLLADKIGQIPVSVQESNTNMEKLITRAEGLEARVRQQTSNAPLSQTNITKEQIELGLMSSMIKSKKRFNSRGTFKSSMIITPDFGNATVEFMAIFDQEEIIKRNSAIIGFLDTKNYITRFTNESLNAERLQLLAPREKLRIISAKVLRKKVSKNYNKPNKFGCLTGRSKLGDEGLYNKNGIEVVCESYGPSPRSLDESIKFLSNASYEDLYSESQTLIPLVNTQGSLIDMSSFLLSPDLLPSHRPPKRAAFAIKDTSIMAKLQGTYQYGMELTYLDPADRLIEETLYKTNVLVFCLQKLLDHANTPNHGGSGLISRILHLQFNRHNKGVMTSTSMEPLRDLFSIFYGYLGYEIEDFTFPDFSHLFPNPSTVGNRVRGMLETSIINCVVDCYSLICTIRAVLPQITLEEIRHLAAPIKTFSASNPQHVVDLERVIDVIKNLISTLSKLTNHPLSKMSTESMYNLDQNISPKTKNRKTFKVTTWFENPNGKDHYVDVTTLRSPSMASINDIITQAGIKDSEADVRQYETRLVTQEAIREMYQKEVEKFNTAPGIQPLSFENNQDALFTVTPDFYRLRDYTTQKELAIPLFEDVAGADYFAAAYSSNNSQLSAERILNRERGDFGYTQSVLMRENANVFTMMLGMFHILSHLAKLAQEASGTYIEHEYAAGYNFLFDYYDPSVLISSLTTKQYYSNQKNTPISSMPNSGFISDSPTVLDGGETSIFSSDEELVPYITTEQDVNVDLLKQADDTGVVPNIYSSNFTGNRLRKTMIRDYIQYCRNKGDNFGLSIYEANRYISSVNSVIAEFSAQRPDLLLSTDTMITLAVQHLLDQVNVEETGTNQTNFPGSYYYRYPGQPSFVYLNPLIYGEVKMLLKLKNTMGDLLLGGDTSGVSEYVYDDIVTIGEVERGLEPGLYAFIRMPSAGSTFSSMPAITAPFRVIDDSDPRSRPVTIDRGLYTSGGEFKYPMSHLTKAGREYIGYYHFHEESGQFMEGAYHSGQEHSILERHTNLNFQNTSALSRRRTLREGFRNAEGTRNVYTQPDEIGRISQRSFVEGTSGASTQGPDVGGRYSGGGGGGNSGGGGGGY